MCLEGREMQWEPIAQASITGLTGLVGVGVGSLLTHWRDLRAEKQKKAQAVGFLAVIVLTSLRDLAEECLAVAYDDGTEMGRPAGEDDTYQAVVSTPVFKPLELNVDWKELPADLLHDILTIPSRIADVDAEVSAYWDAEGPPYDGGFDLRQLRFAKLGLRVCETMERLRGAAGLKLEAREPSRATLRTRLEARFEHLDTLRIERERRHTNLPLFHIPPQPG